MLRALSLASVCALLLTTACSSKSVAKVAGPLTGQSLGAKKKDCDACEKMCKVAGDTEKNKGGVEDCIKDCHKDCS